MAELHEIFCTCCLWSWLGPPMLCTSGFAYTICFLVIALWHIMCIPKWRWNMTSMTAKIPTKFCSTIKNGRIVIVSRALGAKSAIYVCLVCGCVGVCWTSRWGGMSRNLLMMSIQSEVVGVGGSRWRCRGTGPTSHGCCYSARWRLAARLRRPPTGFLL